MHTPCFSLNTASGREFRPESIRENHRLRRLYNSQFRGVAGLCRDTLRLWHVQSLPPLSHIYRSTFIPYLNTQPPYRFPSADYDNLLTLIQNISIGLCYSFQYLPQWSRQLPAKVSSNLTLRQSIGKSPLHHILNIHSPIITKLKKSIYFRVQFAI
jgi:hypothetical protein